MLTATTLVSNLSDLRGVCRFLQRLEWLSQNLPPNTFADKDDVELGLWQPFASLASEDSNEQKAIFTPVADPFRDYEEHGSYVHCTSKARDRYISYALNNAAKLQLLQRDRTLGEDDIDRLSDSRQRVGDYRKEILRILILRCSMVSRVPFRVGKPIIDIPVMRTVTTRLHFANDGSKGLYSMLINNYSKMRAAFGTQVPEGQLAPIPGHKFGPVGVIFV
jgi:hypothetical protein